MRSHGEEPNTDEVAQMLRERYPNREMICYPDPTGKARKTAAAGVTDHGILRNRTASRWWHRTHRGR